MNAATDIAVDFFVACTRAVDLGFIVSLTSALDFDPSVVEEEEQRRKEGRLMEVYEPLAALGWQNYMVDDEGDIMIVVRFEVVG